MKIGVIKLGARIIWETNAAVGPGEAISICKAVSNAAETHVFTKILSKDVLDPSLVWHNILEDQDSSALDYLLVINGNVNFFGGAEDEAQINNYKVINNAKCPVIYIMCDPELPFMQIWDNVSKKPWGTKYSKEQIFISKDIFVLSQAFDVSAVKNKWEKKKGTVSVSKFFHFEMDKFPFLNERLMPNENYTYDLLYGGTARGGRRLPKLYDFYWNHVDINVALFGSIDLSDFQKYCDIKETDISPNYLGQVKYGDVLKTMNASLSHCVVGDPSYEVLDLIPQRVAECVSAGNVIFVDASMDKSNRIFDTRFDTVERDFLYVKDSKDLNSKILELKNDTQLKSYFANKQYNLLSIDKQAFCQKLVSVICKETS